MPAARADSTEDTPGSSVSDTPAPEPANARGAWSFGSWLLLYVGTAVLCFALYQPALDGEFISDDLELYINNPFVNELSLANLAAIFDLRFSEKSFTANYAPIHELMMAFERHFFGDRLVLYHSVNILFHALNSVLLVAWLRSSRLPAAGALLGGLIFAVHPANVEAVAWMSQIKTNGALAFSLLALLLLRPAPAAATLVFGLALLTKASALFALPTAAALVYCRRGAPGGGAAHWLWIGGWMACFGLYTIPEYSSFQSFGESQRAPYPDVASQAMSMAAYAGQYLVMAATSLGLSTFHEPAPVTRLLDPRWLVALPVFALIGWRFARVSRRRSEEAAYWVAAAAGYAPVSQILPFLYPIGDRYLYFVLPGLIGATVFVAVEAGERLAASPSARAKLAHSAIAGALLLAVFFGYRSFGRAGVWRDGTRVWLDAERHYPDGGPAHLLRARRAAQMGEVTAAVAALGRAEARGLADFMVLQRDPALAPILGTQEFGEFLHGMAGRWVVRSQTWKQMNQAQYHMLAHAHMVRAETALASEALVRAIAAGGPQKAVLEAELAELRLGSGGAPSEPTRGDQTTK